MQSEISSNQATRWAGKISIINGLGFITALLIDIFIASKFGLGQTTDALLIALTLPQLLITIFLVAVNVAFVPFFTKTIIEQSIEIQWTLTSNLVNFAWIIFLPLSLVGYWASPTIVTIIGAGLDPLTKNLAIDLSRILFLMVIPVGTTEIMKATLNALNSFTYPAATTLLKNLTVLLAIILTPSPSIRFIAVFYVVSSFVPLLFLTSALVNKGYKYQFKLCLNEQFTLEALRQIRYPLIGEIIGQGNIIVERFFASFLPVGIVSTLGYARRVLRAVDSIFIGSITIAFLPRLSAQSIGGQKNEYKKSLTTSIKILAFISFPLTALIWGWSESIIAFLFERGAFNETDTQAVSLFLKIYILSIPSWAVFQALQTSYYSGGDTKRPFIFRVLTFFLSAFLNGILFIVFKASGLALALILTRTVVTGISGWILQKQIKIFNMSLFSFLGRLALSALILCITTAVSRDIFTHSLIFSNYSELIDIFLRICLGFFVFSLSLFVLRVEEVSNLFKKVLRRTL